MINLDALLLDFIEQNSVTLALVFGVLKVLASHSKSTIDDSVLDYLSSFVRTPKEEKEHEIELREANDGTEKNKIS